jgi:hypothetical protein
MALWLPELPAPLVLPSYRTFLSATRLSIANPFLVLLSRL